MGTTTQLGMERLAAPGQGNPQTTLNEALDVLDAVARLSVKDRDLNQPAGGEVEGDRLMVGGTPAGAWSTFAAGSIAVLLNGAWKNLAPKEGWRCWVDDEDVELVHNGSAWVEAVGLSIATGIAASTTQTQGQQPLTKAVNIVATVANVDDVVTLPAAAKGRRCIVVNQGANRLQVFPASGDAIEAGAADAPTTIVTASRKDFFAVDATTWYQV